MTDVPEISGNGNSEDVVFDSSDYDEPETLEPVKEVTAPVPEEKKPAGSQLFLENKKNALIIGVIGFVVIVVIFVFLFGTIDWDLIMNPPVNP